MQYSCFNLDGYVMYFIKCFNIDIYSENDQVNTMCEKKRTKLK